MNWFANPAVENFLQTSLYGFESAWSHSEEITILLDHTKLLIWLESFPGGRETKLSTLKLILSFHRSNKSGLIWLEYPTIIVSISFGSERIGHG